MKLIFSFFIILFVVSVQGQDREVTYTEGDQEIIMKKYFMLIFIRGDQSEELTEGRSKSLQDAHLKHIDSMAEAGVVLMAGPFETEDEKREILIFDVETEDEIHVWMKGDPLVALGRLTYEILPWWTEKGRCLN